MRIALFTLIGIILAAGQSLAGVGGPVTPQECLPTERDVTSASVERAMSGQDMSAFLKNFGIGDEEIGDILVYLTDEEIAALSEAIAVGGKDSWGENFMDSTVDILGFLLIIGLIGGAIVGIMWLIYNYQNRPQRMLDPVIMRMAESDAAK